MLLTSSAYFTFLAGLVLLFWLTPAAAPAALRRPWILGLILLANYFFYAKWDLLYLGLIPAASAIDYGLARAIVRWRSRGWLAMSLALNCGLLFASRYAVPVPFAIGLSFYAFQSMSYTLDVYRGDAKPTESLLSYLAAASFFPVALAGPITRPASLMPQWERPLALTAIDGGRALFLLGLGATKKFLIADFLGENLVNRVFDTPKLYSGLEVLAAVYGYAFQLYYDFSGYSDIAVGSALLLGLKIPINFQSPYRATHLADFWRRWHISLSNWLRDYVYFSFPGLRGSLMPYAALFLTMVIGGIWHGGTINFVIWGALHGAGLVLVRWWQLQRRPMPAWAGRLLTFHFVAAAWIFFRAADLPTVAGLFGRLASGTVATGNLTGPYVMVLTAGAALHYLPPRWTEAVRDYFATRPALVQAAALFWLLVGIQYVAATGSAPFIYSRF